MLFQACTSIKTFFKQFPVFSLCWLLNYGCDFLKIFGFELVMEGPMMSKSCLTDVVVPSAYAATCVIVFGESGNTVVPLGLHEAINSHGGW